MPTFRDNLHLGSKDPLIDADSIADHSITNDKLACDSVGSCQIQDGAVTQEKTTGIMPEIYALRDKLDQRTAEREAADRDLQADVAELKRTSVKSVSVNSGTKVYPDANGNVNLPIAIDEGGQPYTPPDITELQNDVAALQEDVSDLQDATDALDELVSGEGGIDDRLAVVESTAYTRYIPLVALLETSPAVEQSSWTGGSEGYQYSYVWDIEGSRLLLRVWQPLTPIGTDTKYYMSWNRNPTGIASSDIDLGRDFFYTLADESLTIYKYKALTPTRGKLVATGSGSGEAANVLIVNASNARVGTNSQYLFDCDKSNTAIYNHVVGGGIAIVKGSLAGNFQAILSGTSYVDGVYCATGVTEINGNLYTLVIKNPINFAQSTLYASQPVNRMFTALDNRITENENNISELLFELGNIKGASKFIPLGAILTSSPSVSAETLAVKKSGCSYAYVWLKPLKKLLVQETVNNALPARVYYYDTWSDSILGTSSSDINPTNCFFYSFGDDSMTIWHWKGNASTGDLVPSGADLTTINNYLTEISNVIGTIPSGVNSIGDFIDDVQSRVDDIEYNIERITDPANKDFIPLAAVENNPVGIQSNTLTALSDNATYDYIWDREGKRVLLREIKTISGGVQQVKLYAAWVLPDTGFIPSNTFATKKYDYFFYTTNESLLTIWHWSPQAENIVPTGAEAQGGDDEEDPYVPFDPSDIEPIEPDDQGDDEDYSTNPAYPEYYGAQGDATEYYDWPLVCFGGINNSNLTIESSASTIEVYAPGERIYYKYGMTEDYFGKSLDYTSSDVIYSSVNKKFLLHADNKYYGAWANSEQWNDPVTGLARTDTLYSDVEELAPNEKTTLDPNDEFGLCRRKTYIFQSNELQNLFNQDSTQGTVFLHDDGPALYAWFEANKGTNQEMKLAPNKVYYIASQQVINGTRKNLGLGSANASKMFECVSNTIVNGNGSTIFARMSSTGWPPSRVVPPNVEHSNSVTIFQLNRCSNVTIKNVNFKSLKDRDANAPNGSNSRFSTSSSAINALSCGLVGSAYDKNTGEPLIRKGVYQASNITIEDIECKNISCPINFSHGAYFTIKNVTATGVVNNGFGLAHSTYDNVHLTSAPYIGSGMHIFYGGCYTDDLTITNSTFKTTDPYTEVMITFHGGNQYLGNASSAPNIGTTSDIKFQNCVFEGGTQLFRGDKYSAGRLCVWLTDCIVKTQFNKQIGALYYGYPKKWSTSTSQADIDPKYGALIAPVSSTWYIDGCTIHVGDGTLTDYGVPRGDSKISIKDTTIVSTRETQGMRLIGCQSTYDGQIEASNIQTNYPGPYGISSDAISPIDDDPEEYPEYATPPTNPSVGDIYVNTTDGKTYRCVSVGKATRIGLRVYVSSFPYTATHTISFSNGETIQASISNAASVDDVADAIVAACVTAGYTDVTGISGYIGSKEWQPGKVTKHPSGSHRYVIVTSKALGNFTRSFSPDSTSTIHIQKTGTTYNYQCGNGIDNVWEDITTTATSEGGSSAGTEQQGQG